MPEIDIFASSTRVQHHHSGPYHIRIVFAVEACEGPNIDSCSSLDLTQHALCGHCRRINHDQHYEGDKSRNFLAALAQGACLLLRRSIRMDCSRKTPSQSLSRFRVAMRTRLSLRYHENLGRSPSSESQVRIVLATGGQR